MRKPEYKRCPRCELNFIKKSEKLCSVCLAELNSKDSYISDLDLELCPICKTNYIQPGEIMCSTCLKEHQNEDGELSADWELYMAREEDDDYVDPDEETGEMASITDSPEDLLSSGYDDIDEFDDDDLGDLPEGMDDDDDDDLENDDDDEYEDDDDDDF